MANDFIHVQGIELKGGGQLPWLGALPSLALLLIFQPSPLLPPICLSLSQFLMETQT